MTTTKTTSRVTLADGTTQTRASAKAATHAVVGKWEPGDALGVVGWHGSLKLAQAKLDWCNQPILRERYPNAIWEIVEVESAG
jgi:hypothetical protein